MCTSEAIRGVIPRSIPLITMLLARSSRSRERTVTWKGR